MKNPARSAGEVACVPAPTRISAWYLAVLLLVVLCGCGGGSGNGSGSGSNGGSGTGSGSGGGGGSTPPPPALTTRTRYVRTDASTPYFLMNNTNWIVYDSGTNRFFVSDTFGNRITVLDAAAEKVVTNIPVPGAFGIDFTADHSVLYAGTQIGDVYAIDPVALKVTRRYIASHIGPYGYQAYVVGGLKDRRLALLGSQGGLPVDGYGSYAIWDPSTNAFTMYVPGYSGSPQMGFNIPAAPACPHEGHIANFFLSGDRTHIVTSSADSDGTICSMDATTGQSAETSRGGFIWHLVATPDGTELVQPGGVNGDSQVLIYDAKTLSLLRSFPVVADTSSGAAVTISADSKTVYLDGDTFIYAYDLATGALVGWVPRLTVQPTIGGSAMGPPNGPNFQAISTAGLLAGPATEGVGFIDTTALQTGKVGTGFLNAYYTPPTGPTSGGTQVQWTSFTTVAPAAVYFGRNLATNVSADSNGVFHATTPPGPAGPVDVYSLMSDGGMQIVSEGFSYGPTVLQVTPDASTAEGGGVGLVFGYGFGSTVYNTPIPSDLQVTVGGTPVKITAYTGNAYGISSPPFNLEAFAYTIPGGTAGTSADVVVTTPSGSAKVTGAMHYLPALQSYPLAGAAMSQGVYDPGRNLYYFTDAGVIQVFSRSAKAWQTPIPVPAPPSGTSHRLWAMALSPNGSKLAVSDAGTGMIYVMDPGNPSAIQSFALIPAVSGTTPVPAGLAISDSGNVYFAAAWAEGSPGVGGPFLKLDTNNGTFTSYNVTDPGSTADYFLRAAISSDGARVYFNDDGAVFSVDAATDSVSWSATSSGNGDGDLSLSPNQTQFTATGGLYDADLNGDAFLSLNDREVVNTAYVYGAKLSADGTLLFQPSVQGIDVFDGRLGTLRTRISLPVPVSEGFDALVSDGTDNQLVILTGETGTGIALVDLSSPPEPAPLAYSSVVEHSGQNWTAWSMPRPASKPAARMSRVPHRVNQLVRGHVLIPSTSAQLQ